MRPRTRGKHPLTPAAPSRDSPIRPGDIRREDLLLSHPPPEDSVAKLQDRYLRALETIVCEQIADKRDVVALAARIGATAVMPDTDDRLLDLGDAPASVLDPAGRRFVKEAMRRRYDLDGVVDRPRLSMQAGTGLRGPFKAALRDRFASRGRSFGRILRSLSE